MKESFIVYQSFEKTFELLTDHQAKRLIMAMFALNRGIDQCDDFLDDPMLEMAFSVIAGQMERDMQKYLNKVNAGRKSGEARKKNASARTETNSVRTVDSDTVTVSVTESVSDTDTVSDSESVVVTESVSDTDTVSDSESVVVTESVSDTGVFSDTEAPVSFARIKEFFAKNHFTSNPKDFYDYNSLRGWKVNGEKMKNWKSAARRWERKEKDFANGKTARVKVKSPDYIPDMFRKIDYSTMPGRDEDD